MKIGKKVTIYQDNSEYVAKIIDKDKQYVYLDIPIHIETEKSTYIPVETKIDIKYAGKDGAAYRFTTKIVAHKTLRVPTLVVNVPQSVERIQRREFVRVQAAIDVAVHSLAHKFPAFTTVTYDISAGGASIILGTHNKVSVGDQVELIFAFQMNNEAIHYVMTNARLLRLDEQKGQPILGSFQFTNISAKDQQKFVQLCLEIQREARQKELQ